MGNALTVTKLVAIIQWAPDRSDSEAVTVPITILLDTIQKTEKRSSQRTHTQGKSWESLDTLEKRLQRDYTPAELETYLNAKRQAAATQRAACSDFLDKLCRGEIVAFGLLNPEGATGRYQIDAALWDTLRAKSCPHGTENRSFPAVAISITM